MAVGTGTVVGLGILAAGSQILAGQKQAKSIERVGEFNAQVYEQQAGMILEQKRLQDYQYNRFAARTRGSLIARTAGKGLNLSGSPLAILIDNESQMLLDKAVGDYNLDVQSNYAKSGALASRYAGREQGRLARFTGYSNAFSTALNTTGYMAGRL